jgi:hypothetical protein
MFDVKLDSFFKHVRLSDDLPPVWCEITTRFPGRSNRRGDRKAELAG